jgi:hypothetical protein
VTLTFHALWMLCALSTAVLATVVRTRLDWTGLALGFGLATAWTIRSGRSAGRVGQAGRAGRPHVLLVLFVSFVGSFVMEKAMAAPVTAAAGAAEDFVRSNEAPPASPHGQAPQQVPIPARSLVAQDLRGLQKALKGSVMEEKDRSRASPRGSATIIVPSWVTAGLTLPVLAYLVVWRRRHRRTVRKSVDHGHSRADCDRAPRSH